MEIIFRTQIRLYTKDAIVVETNITRILHWTVRLVNRVKIKEKQEALKE
jgi:hypothetical protein